MLITFAGRKSDITVFSLRNRVWWRNLHGGAMVTVRVKGQDLKAMGESFEDKEVVAANLLAYLQKSPKYAKYFQVTLNSSGQPNPEEVDRAAQNRVMIRIKSAYA